MLFQLRPSDKDCNTSLFLKPARAPNTYHWFGTYTILAHTLHLHWRPEGAVMRQSLQTRSLHSSQRSPRSKIRPRFLRQRAHCRSPSSWGWRQPFRLISSNSFFSFLPQTKKKNWLNKKKSTLLVQTVMLLTVCASPLVSSASHLSAAPLKSSLVRVRAKRRGSSPQRLAPLVPFCRTQQPIRNLESTTLCCSVVRCFYHGLVLYSDFLMFPFPYWSCTLHSGNLDKVKERQKKVRNLTLTI